MTGLRLAARQLVRYPAFSGVVIATLALGLGASTLIFSVVNGVLLKPLPYPDPDRIVRVLQVNENGFVGQNISEPNFGDLKQQARSFSALARYAVGTQPVSGGSEPTRVETAIVSGEFFDVVALQPIVGRAFLLDERQLGAAPAAIISYSYWQRFFGGDPALGTRTLKIADRTYSIVGVMPAGFDYPDGAEIWTPAELWPLGESRTAHNWRVVGRLADGVSLAQARSDLSAIARRLRADYGDDTWMVDAAVDPLRDVLVRAARPALLVLLAAVGLLFAVAVANAANLVLARAVSRAWLRQPSFRPTTRITGSSSARTRSDCSRPSASGASQPPTPSTTTCPARPSRARYAATIGGRVTTTPARAAAICGAVGSGRAQGFTSA